MPEQIAMVQSITAPVAQLSDLSLFEQLLNIKPWLLQQQTIARRGKLFNEIVKAMATPPGHVDTAMNQDGFWYPVLREEQLMDRRLGNLILHMRPMFFGTEYHYWYSIWQLGSLLKIGILFPADVARAPLLDWNREIHDLWYGSVPEVFDRKGLTLYEWSFDLPDLYDSWLIQERVILGMRHCHFRVLRIVHDYAKALTEDDN